MKFLFPVEHEVPEISFQYDTIALSRLKIYEQSVHNQNPLYSVRSYIQRFVVRVYI